MADGPTGLGSERTYDGPPSTSSGLTGPLTTRHCPKPSRSQTRSTDAPSATGISKSSPGITPTSATDPPNQPTTSSNASNASPSASQLSNPLPFLRKKISPNLLTNPYFPSNPRAPQRAPKHVYIGETAGQSVIRVPQGGCRYTPVHTLLA